MGCLLRPPVDEAIQQCPRAESLIFYTGPHSDAKNRNTFTPESCADCSAAFESAIVPVVVMPWLRTQSWSKMLTPATLVFCAGAMQSLRTAVNVLSGCSQIDARKC